MMNGKRWLKGLGIALLALLTAVGLAEPTDGTVRVLLSRLGASDALSFRANCGYTLNDVEIPAETDVTVRLADGQLEAAYGDHTISCGAEAKFLRGASGGSGVRFLSQKTSDLYCGDLCLTIREDAIAPILSMDVEDYLCGVLGGIDMDPMEAIKAAAIAARSTALRRREASQPYDFTDDSDGYVFEGCSMARERSRQAVEATQGSVLYADDVPALCPYTQSNGGQAELPSGAVKDDPYDLECRTAEVRTAVIRRDGDGLDARLRQYLIDAMTEQLKGWGLSAAAEDVSIRRITSVEPADPADPESGRVCRAVRMGMEIRSTNPSTGKPVDCSVSLEVPIFGGIEDWYALSINPEANETATVTETAEAFEIALRRSGSGVGLSRCGANTMASGYDMDCAAILDFYFPGTEMRTLELSARDADGEPARTPSPYALPTLPPVEPEAADSPTAEPEIEAAASAMPESVMVKFLTLESEISDEKQEEAVDVPLDGEKEYDSLDELLSDEEFGDPDETSDDDIDDLDELPLDDDFGDLDELPLDDDFDDLDELPLDDDFDDLDELPLDDDFNDLDELPLDDDFDDLGALPLDDDFNDLDELPLDDDFGDLDALPLDDELDDLDELPLDDADASEDAAMTAPAEEMRRYVNVKESGSLTLRSRPSKNGEKLGKLRRGEALRVMEFNDEWARVKLEDGREGYVSMAYLSEDAPKEESGDAWTRFKATHADAKRCDKTARVRVNVRMRAEASTEAEIVCKVAGGKEVAVRGYDDEWAYVSYKDKTGFIMKKYLKFGA